MLLDATDHDKVHNSVTLGVSVWDNEILKYRYMCDKTDLGDGFLISATPPFV